jgi:flagellar basal body P-ring protein FlgI
MAAMNIKNFAAMMVAALLAANAAFGQTITVTGNVSALTDAQISLLCGPDTWNINRTSTTTVTNGTLAVGNTVTVQCLSTDARKVSGNAQKKE